MYQEFTSIFHEEVLEENNHDNVMNKFASKFTGGHAATVTRGLGSVGDKLNKTVKQQDNINFKPPIPTTHSDNKPESSINNKPDKPASNIANNNDKPEKHDTPHKVNESFSSD